MCDPNSPRPALDLGDLLSQLDACRERPLMTLQQALLQLALLQPPTLDALAAQEPALLRSRHGELVDRLLLTEDDLGRALALMAGLPEIDAANFEIFPEALRQLPARTARAHEVLPLGAAREHFFVASGRPTREALRHHLSTLVEEPVVMVWAPSEAIVCRLDAEELLTAAALRPAPPIPWTLPPSAAARPSLPLPATPSAPAPGRGEPPGG